MAADWWIQAWEQNPQLSPCWSRWSWGYEIRQPLPMLLKMESNKMPKMKKGKDEKSNLRIIIKIFGSRAIYSWTVSSSTREEHSLQSSTYRDVIVNGFRQSRHVSCEELLLLFAENIPVPNLSSTQTCTKDSTQDQVIIQNEHSTIQLLDMPGDMSQWTNISRSSHMTQVGDSSSCRKPPGGDNLQHK